MKKLILFMLMFMVMFSSVFALRGEFNQEQNVIDYFNEDKGNRFYKIYSALTNEIGIPISTGANTTDFRPYDYKLDLIEVNEPFYIILDNFYENSTYTIYYSGDLNSNKNVFYRNVTLQESGEYYFKFTPESSLERSVIYIDYVKSNSSEVQFGIYYQETKPEGFSSAIEVIVQSASDVIDININLWKIVYYTLIFALVVTFIFGIFGFAFMLFSWAKKLKEGETPESTTRRSKRRDNDEEED